MGKINSKGLAVGLITIIVILVFILVGGPKITGNVIHNIGCEQVTEYRTEYKTETYYSSAKNCDASSKCTCLHKSWLGLGACDSCRCYREVEVSIPYTVEKCLWE